MGSRSDFGLRLSRPLKLKTGLTIGTLGEAATFIGNLPEFPCLRPVWELACDAVARAARTRDQADLEAATCELELALLADKLLDDARIDRQFF